jgi:hypothetical protein
MEMLHDSMKTIGVPWIVGNSLHAQGSKVYKNKNCKKALGYGRKLLDADGFIKAGNLQANYFHYVNTCMQHELKHPQHHGQDENGVLTGLGKPDKCMFVGYICLFFILQESRESLTIAKSLLVFQVAMRN